MCFSFPLFILGFGTLFIFIHFAAPQERGCEKSLSQYFDASSFIIENDCINDHLTHLFSLLIYEKYRKERILTGSPDTNRQFHEAMASRLYGRLHVVANHTT